MTLKEAKRGFFDRKKVQRSVDTATRRVLSRFGAFVRTRARTSIRKRTGTSPPGRPPYSHVGLLRRLIFFAYDRRRRSVVVGPVLIRRDSQAPELLEHGGQTLVRTGGRRGRLRYRPRPYMGPAFQREQQNLSALWRDSIR
ncbi:MAG TPA: hypothetical protein EYP14_13685 [Planctomycetaceae bacterium]|nr:hypothetical protein [Planctomycetaceae bacterium]